MHAVYVCGFNAMSFLLLIQLMFVTNLSYSVPIYKDFLALSIFFYINSFDFKFSFDFQFSFDFKFSDFRCNLSYFCNFFFILSNSSLFFAILRNLFLLFLHFSKLFDKILTLLANQAVFYWQLWVIPGAYLRIWLSSHFISIEFNRECMVCFFLSQFSYKQDESCRFRSNSPICRRLFY